MAAVAAAAAGYSAYLPDEMLVAAPVPVEQ